MKPHLFWLQTVALVTLCLFGSVSAQTLTVTNNVLPVFCPKGQMEATIVLNNGATNIPASTLTYDYAAFLTPDIGSLPAQVTNITPPGNLTQVKLAIASQSSPTLTITLRFTIDPCLAVGSGTVKDVVIWTNPVGTPKFETSYNATVPVLEVRNNTPTGSRDSYVGLIFNDPLASIIVQNNKSKSKL